MINFEEINEVAALKIYYMPDDEKARSNYYNYLKSEFKLLNSLSHPNIIQYYCFYKPCFKKFPNDQEFGVIMEYMPGGSLERFINENKRAISLETIKAFTKDILEGLNHLHMNKIIHRDLKVNFKYKWFY